MDRAGDAARQVGGSATESHSVDAEAAARGDVDITHHIQLVGRGGGADAHRAVQVAIQGQDLLGAHGGAGVGAVFP